MRILNVSIRDFRNIVKAEVKFGRLNVLTGRNSSGKSNFLLALSHGLSIEKDYFDVFSNNIVTYHQGKDSATITTKIGEISTNSCYLGEKGQDDSKFFCINPETFEFEKIIEKKTASSKSHRLTYTGKYFRNPDDGPTWREYINRKDALANTSYVSVKDKEVYAETFFADLVQENGTKVVKVADLPDQDKYLNYFSEYQSSVISWVKNNPERNESLTSSDVIHRYVTESGSGLREVYEQVLERIKKTEKSRFGITVFEKSKFIFLLADIQRNPAKKEALKSDLVLYTRGILSDININNKGEIVVTSPNGPDDIWTISNGTSVLLFFIVLLNWITLPPIDKSYKSPNVMIFDEIDSIIHPTLMPEFKEVLERLSAFIQLFISSHSPYFIEKFDKTQLYLIKDTPSLPGGKKLMNRCNIYDYKTIISYLPAESRDEFMKMSNSDLFINGTIDAVFPSNQP